MIPQTAHSFFGAGSERGRLVLDRLLGEAEGLMAGPPAEPSEGAAPEPSGPPADAAADTEMRPVLLAYDGSPGARHAIRHAAAVLDGGPALVACLWEPAERGLLVRTTAPEPLAELADDVAGELDRRAENRALRTAAEGTALAAELGFAAEPIAIRAPRPVWRSLAGLAEARDARLVVLGPRGRSCARALVGGSLSHALIHRCPVPMLVVGPDAGSPEVPTLTLGPEQSGACVDEEVTDDAGLVAPSRYASRCGASSTGWRPDARARSRRHP